MKRLLLVNPLASPAYIDATFRKSGVETVALFTFSKDEATEYVAPNESFFNETVFSNTTDLKPILRLIEKYDFDYILNGSEYFAEITEFLIKLLLPHYAVTPEDVIFRSNKFYMQEALRIAHLPYIKQVQVNKDSLDISQLRDFRFPFFAKPLNGNCSIGASYINSFKELETLLETPHHTVLSQEIDTFLVQEIVQGDEIFVDTFSVNGSHYTSSVQTIRKEIRPDPSPCYRDEILIRDSTIWNSAADFVKIVLDATGFTNGFAHVELFRLRDGSYLLLEINPRISGAKGMPNMLAEAQALKSQIDLLVEHLQGKEPDESQCAQIKGHGAILYLYNFSDRPTRDPRSTLEALPSYRTATLCATVGVPPASSVKTLANVDCLALLYTLIETQ